MDANIIILSNKLLLEILNAVGLPKRDSLCRLIAPIFRKATLRMAAIGVTFDGMVAEQGFSKAADWALSNWCRDITSHGQEHVPSTGPVLFISNHPGTYDSLVITSQARRDDVLFISSNIPFLKNLPNTQRHFRFITLETTDRMIGARHAIRHLMDGAAVLLFGSGHIDPDPAVYPGAAEHIERWSPSIDIFLRKVPQTRVVLSMVSGVLSRTWGYSPIIWLRRKGLDKRRLAEFGQVLHQLSKPGTLFLSPTISFAKPLLASDLGENPRGRLVDAAKALLTEHMAFIQETPA
ncbi:MAG: 1-acyl-sn-glycerol-3-phosphate acyltransferase [Chloroflexota bacterium]